MRAVFMGSPEFALPSLEALAAHYSVVGVVTQPDRPAGRGRKLQPSAVKTRALALGLPVLEPGRGRGAAPIQAAILHGDETSGVPSMRMDEALDTRPILAQSAASIQPHETGGE